MAYRSQITIGMIAAFVIYLLLFRGPAETLRRHATAALMLFLVGLGIELAARHLLFSGWSDPNDLPNRQQLYAIAEQFSRYASYIGAFALAVLFVLAIFRRLTHRPGE